MPGFDPLSGNFFFPAWMAGAMIALIIATYAVSSRRLGTGDAISLLVSSVGILAVIGIALFVLDRAQIQDRAVERRALEARENDISTRFLSAAPALGCLDSAAGDVVENSCERALFVSPAAIAAAVSYVSARLALLFDQSMYAKSNGDAFRYSRAALRRAAERDRFGLHAHVLAVQYGCTPMVCAFFGLFQDLERVKANLRARTFDTLIDRYATTWPNSDAPQIMGPPQAAITSSQKPAVTRGLDFPSAASIPPVSIMDPEPGVPAGIGPIVPPGAVSPRPNRAPSGQTPLRQPMPQTLVPPIQLSPGPDIARPPHPE